MAFGLSFGAKKGKTNQTSTIDKTENMNQQQSGTTATEGTTSQTGSQTSTGQTTSTSGTQQTTSGVTTGSQTGTTQQTTKAYSDNILGSLESAVSQLLGTTGAGAAADDFDIDSFVTSGMQAATHKADTGLQTNLNQLMDSLGSATGNNTMGALLQNAMSAESAASLAGTKANLTAQGEQISRENSLAANTIGATQQGFLTQLLDALKGGSTTAVGTESQANTQSQSGSTTGTTTGSESTSQQQQTEQTQTQKLLETLNQILTGTTNTTGTETVKGKTSSGGGGFSLGF